MRVRPLQVNSMMPRARRNQKVVCRRGLSRLPATARQLTGFVPNSRSNFEILQHQLVALQFFPIAVATNATPKLQSNRVTPSRLPCGKQLFDTRPDHRIPRGPHLVNPA